MEEKINVTKDSFEKIKHTDENGVEFWYARELMKALEYVKWDKFIKVIENAMVACKSSNNALPDHFLQVGKLIKTAKNAEREIIDYKLSRYACYLIVQNADPKKESVALGQTYFAIQTRKQELFEKEYSMLTEDEKRLYNRNLTKKGNYALNQTAKNAGVKNFDKFHNAGYKGLYNGETADDIAKRKNLRYREEILDNMCSEELADNLFRIVQTETKLKKDNIKTEDKANATHFLVGRKIRNTIKDLGGTMPEDLPTPKKTIKQVEKEINNKLIDK